MKLVTNKPSFHGGGQMMAFYAQLFVPNMRPVYFHPRPYFVAPYQYCFSVWKIVVKFASNNPSGMQSFNRGFGEGGGGGGGGYFISKKYVHKGGGAVCMCYIYATIFFKQKLF